MRAPVPPSARAGDLRLRGGQVIGRPVAGHSAPGCGHPLTGTRRAIGYRQPLRRSASPHESLPLPRPWSDDDEHQSPFQDGLDEVEAAADKGRLLDGLVRPEHHFTRGVPAKPTGARDLPAAGGEPAHRGHPAGVRDQRICRRRSTIPPRGSRSCVSTLGISSRTAAIEFGTGGRPSSVRESVASAMRSCGQADHAGRGAGGLLIRCMMEEPFTGLGAGQQHRNAAAQCGSQAAAEAALPVWVACNPAGAGADEARRAARAGRPELPPGHRDPGR